jgi:hypothetical protein
MARLKTTHCVRFPSREHTMSFWGPADAEEYDAGIASLPAYSLQHQRSLCFMG